MKKELTFMIFLLLVGLVVAADFMPEVGEEFTVTKEVTCLESSCEYTLGIGYPIEESITHYHENSSSIDEQDCFGGTCLKMPMQGPLFNVSGNVNWACGVCDTAVNWISGDLSALAKGDNPCINGMKNIVGEELCVETDNGEEWNIIFEIWSSAGSDEVKYTRSRTSFDFLESNSEFSLESQNPQELQLLQGESNIVEFDLKAKKVGDYCLSLSSNGEISELSISVTEKESEDNDDDSDKDTHHKYIQDEPPQYNSQASPVIKDPKETLKLNSNTNKDSDNKNLFLILLGIISLGFIFILTLIIIRP